jgi:hypothetical protein
MGGRFTFLAGFAAGYVFGARAGRERYEQLVKLSRQVMENPAVQQATRTASAKTAEFSKAAGQKASERMPKVAATAKSSASKAKSGASKVRGQLDRRPGRHSGHDESTQANGGRPADEAGGEP